jgi:hypothetical protein
MKRLIILFLIIFAIEGANKLHIDDTVKNITDVVGPPNSKMFTPSAKN